MRFLILFLLLIQGAIFASEIEGKPLWSFGLHNKKNHSMILSVPVPENFHQTSQSDVEMEYVPEGECCCEWSQKITIQLVPGNKSGIIVKKIKDQLEKRFKNQIQQSILQHENHRGISVFQYLYNGPSLAKGKEGEVEPLDGTNEVMVVKAVPIDFETVVILYQIRYEIETKTAKEQEGIEEKLSNFIQSCSF